MRKVFRSLLRKLARLLLWSTAGFLALYTATYFIWNDAFIADTISMIVSGQVRGHGPGPKGYGFVIGKAHYPYLGGLRSIVTDEPCPFEMWDGAIYDTQSKPVARVQHATGKFHVQELLVHVLPTVLTAAHVHIHIVDPVIDGGWADIHLTPAGDVNIVDAMSPRHPSPKGAPPSTGGLKMRVENAEFHDVAFSMGFAGWLAKTPRASGRVPELHMSSFHEDNPDPDKLDFTYFVEPIKADDASLDLFGFLFPMKGVEVTKFRSPDDAHGEMQFHGTLTSRGAPATVDGKLVDVYSSHPGADLRIDFTHGAGLAAMLPTGGLLAGDPAGWIRIHGPFSHILIDGEVHDGEVDLAGIRAVQAFAKLHLDGLLLGLRDTRMAVAGGHVGGKVDIDFQKMTWKGDLHAEHVDPSKLRPLVPPSWDSSVGGLFDGGAHIEGSINPLAHPERVKVRSLDGALARRSKDSLPRVVHFHGDLRYAPELIHLDGMTLSGDGVDLHAVGTIDPNRATTKADVIVDSPRLQPLLTRLQLPQGARRLHADVHAEGPLIDPRIDGDLTLYDVGLGDRRLPRVDSALSFRDGTVYTRHLRGEGLGGTVTGDIALGFWDGDLTRLKKEPTLSLDADADKLRVHVLTGVPDIRGELSGKVHLEGPLAHPTGNAKLSLPQLELFGDPYQNGVADLTFGDELGLKVSLARTGGGRLTGSGRVFYDGRLDVDLAPRDFPLAAIPQLRGLPVAIQGTLTSEDVHFGGEVEHLQVGGTISALAIKVREILLGDGELKLVPGGDAIHLVGEFFHRFKVDGYLTLQPSLATHVTVKFDDLPLDELIPEMKRLAEVKGIVSGEARYSFDVATGSTFAELRLSKVRLTLAADEGGDGEEDEHKGGDEFKNDGPVLLTTDGTRLSFKQAHLRSRIGEFELRGDVSAQDSKLRVVGRIQLQLLEYFASSLFQHTHGDATADILISGPATRPKVIGTLDLRDAEVQPRGVDRAFTVHSGRVVFEEAGVRLANLEVELDGARARADGRLAVKDWVPGDVSIDISGEVSPAVVGWLYPEYVTEPAGRLGIDAHVRGRWPTPTWKGVIDIRDVAFRAKRMGRDFRVPSGTVTLADYKVTFGCPGPVPPDGCRQVVARMDDTGDVRIDGTVDVDGLALKKVDLHVEGRDLEWGAAGVYSLTFSPTVDLVGTGQHLKLAGDVILVSGTYIKQYDIKDLVIAPQRVVEEDPPFWKGLPLWENLELDLVARSSGPLQVKNNLAILQVSVPSLVVGGTLGEPTYDGNVQVESGGTFRIPLLRTDFLTETGSITFEANEPFPSRTPRFDINASAQWSDRYDTIHNIMLKVAGTYQQPDLQLSSQDGWDKNQVLSALLTGGSPDDWRGRFQNDPNARGSAGGDDILKSASGEAFSTILGDPIKNLFGFDVVRIEVGYVKLCPYNSRYVKLCGSGDFGLTSTTRYDARGELKLSDDLSAVLAAEHIEHGLDTTEDIVTRGRLQLRWKFSIY